MENAQLSEHLALLNFNYELLFQNVVFEKEIQVSYQYRVQMELILDFIYEFLD